ncbi:hypothetical protein A17_00507 [Campylobacter jejuni subsp. jejuni]|nr:hypothetical protein A17_00507 [Campylobacter jejuni subsp. jejuni]
MKAYHTKEQVIIKLSKDEYRKEMKLNKSLKDENKSLKTEISNLENEKIELLKELKDQIEANMKNIKEISSLQNKIYELLYKRKVETMFLNSKKNEKIRYLEKEIQRLKGVIALKDTAINEISLKLEEEIKINVKLSNFRIKILDALGLIGVFKNDDKAIKEVKRLKDKECK